MYTHIQREEKKKKSDKSSHHDPYSLLNFEHPSARRANPETREALEARRWGELTELAQTLRAERLQREQSKAVDPRAENKTAISRMPSSNERVESDEVSGPGNVFTKQDEHAPGELQAKSEAVQRSVDGSGNASPQTERKINSMRQSGGAPLDNSTRDFMESRMGHDFSDVRIHTGGDAESTSQDLGAMAYTVGKDIAFNKGEYQPETHEGKKLIAHELTHTIQQGGVKRKSQKKDEKGIESKPIQRTPLKVQRAPQGRQNAHDTANEIVLHLRLSKAWKQRRSVIIKLNHAIRHKYIGQVLIYLEARSAEFGQTKENFVTWMYLQLGEYKPRFLRILRRHGGVNRFARLQAARLFVSKKSEESLNILRSLRGRQLSAFLEYLKPYAKFELRPLAGWIFLHKVRGAQHREILRRHFFKSAWPARVLAAQFTAYQIYKLLRHSERDESDFGIVAYLKETPQKWRERTLSELSVFTRHYFRVDARQKLRSTMLPVHYARLQKMAGIKLHLPARILTEAEKRAVFKDRAKIVASVVLKGGSNYMIVIPKTILIFVGDLGIGLKDAALLVKDFAGLALYKFTDGNHGRGSYFRIKKMLHGIHAFKEDPSGMIEMIVDSLWEDLKVEWHNLVTSGPGSGGRVAVFLGDMAGKLALNLALVYLSLVSGIGAVVKGVSRVNKIIKFIKKGDALKRLRQLRKVQKGRKLRDVARQRRALRDEGLNKSQIDALQKALGLQRFPIVINNVSPGLIARVMKAMGKDGAGAIALYSRNMSFTHFRRVIQVSRPAAIRVLFRRASANQLVRIINKIGPLKFNAAASIVLARHIRRSSAKDVVSLLKHLEADEFLRLLRWMKPADFAQKKKAIGIPALRHLIQTMPTGSGPALRTILQQLDGPTIRVLAIPETGLGGPIVFRLLRDVERDALRKLASTLTGRQIFDLDRALTSEHLKGLAAYLDGTTIRAWVTELGGPAVQALRTGLGDDVLRKLATGLKGVEIKQLDTAFGTPNLRLLANDIDGKRLLALSQSLIPAELQGMIADLGLPKFTRLAKKFDGAEIKKLSTVFGNANLRKLLDRVGAEKLVAIIRNTETANIQTIITQLGLAKFIVLARNSKASELKEWFGILTAPRIVQLLATKQAGNLSVPSFIKLAREIGPKRINFLYNAIGPLGPQGYQGDRALRLFKLVRVIYDAGLEIKPLARALGRNKFRYTTPRWLHNLAIQMGYPGGVPKDRWLHFHDEHVIRYFDFSKTGNKHSFWHPTTNVGEMIKLTLLELNAQGKSIVAGTPEILSIVAPNGSIYEVKIGTRMQGGVLVIGQFFPRKGPDLLILHNWQIHALKALKKDLGYFE